MFVTIDLAISSRPLNTWLRSMLAAITTQLSSSKTLLTNIFCKKCLKYNFYAFLYVLLFAYIYSCDTQTFLLSEIKYDSF